MLDYISETVAIELDMPAVNYIKKVTEDMLKATADIQSAVADIIDKEKSSLNPNAKRYTPKELAELIDKSVSSFRNKVSGVRQFSGPELVILADLLGMKKQSLMVQAYMNLVIELPEMIKALPFTPKLISDLSKIKLNEFYRKLENVHPFNFDEVVRLGDTLEALRNRVDHFVKSPHEALLETPKPALDQEQNTTDIA